MMTDVVISQFVATENCIDWRRCPGDGFGDGSDGSDDGSDWLQYYP